MLVLLEVLLVLTLNVYTSYAWKRPLLLHGRPEHGMLRAPSCGSCERDDPVKEQWFTQYLDHYDPQNTKTWQQRYFVNESYWTDKQKGPVFLMLGGEGPASPYWINRDTDMTRNAKKYGALTFVIEHRFYGKSHPTPDLETNNLRYLSSEQALADVATFHDFIVDKYQLTENNRWISFGGSYSGALSAWLRIKYPHLISGAVATSAPVWPKLNFVEYLEVVQASLATSKQQDACPNAVKVATTKLDAMLSDEDQWSSVESKFSIKPSLQNKNDVMNLASTLASTFMFIVQYNREGFTHNITLDDLCDAMTDTSLGDELDRYAAINSANLKMSKLDHLDVSYEEYINSLKNTSWNSTTAEGARQWFYQTCSEFGYYQTSDSDIQPFGKMFPLDFSVQQCQDVFGPTFTQSFISSRIAWTIANYGSRNISGDIQNIVFPNGSIDPWHALSILDSVNSYTTAVYITGTAHCANMYPPRQEDLPALVNTRQVISQRVGQFLIRG